MTSTATLDLRLPRTRLNYVPSIGCGTPLVESLTGYVMRLAEAHCGTTSALVTDVLLPPIKPQGCETRPAADWLADYDPPFNGMDTRAGQAAAWLLTGRHDLRALTLPSCAKELAPHGLIRLRRPARVWCASCRADRLAGGQPRYESLLWSIAFLTVCPLHHIRLRDCGCSHYAHPIQPTPNRTPKLNQEESLLSNTWELCNVASAHVRDVLMPAEAPNIRTQRLNISLKACNVGAESHVFAGQECDISRERPLGNQTG